MKCSFCGLGHAPGVGLGGAGVTNFSVGIRDGAPSTARSSVMNIKHLIAEKTPTPSLGIYVVSSKYSLLAYDEILVHLLYIQSHITHLSSLHR